jgi:N-acetylglucosamine-6-phosphate deacetylase
MKGNILTPGGWVRGALRYGAMIEAIEGQASDPQDNGDDYILPGFIDVHVHGGAGRDMMEGGDAPHVIAALHARHGTTALLATTMTAPVEDIDRALAAIGAACRQRGKNEARILGVHLEGP